MNERVYSVAIYAEWSLSMCVINPWQKGTIMMMNEPSVAAVGVKTNHTASCDRMQAHRKGEKEAETLQMRRTHNKS